MISVIVTIYNVEGYLMRCLDSLVKQTIHDVEFILIDDGSTDNSGAIADSYKDPRFHIFHTENHGISAARNFGIEKSRGDWLMFVDGDDWVVPEFCEAPYKAAQDYDADMVVFKVAREKQGKVKMSNDKTIGIVDPETATLYGGVTVCNRLYKRELFENVRYPDGKKFEDLATTHQTVFNAKRILFIPDVLYYYVYRPGSITNTKYANNNRDRYDALFQRFEDLISFGYKDETICSTALGLLSRLYPSNETVYLAAQKIVDNVKKPPRYLPWKSKVMMRIWKIDKRVFHLICRALGYKIHRGQV